VYAACRARSSEELTDLATRVDPGYDWDDIVLPAETETQLREVASRLANRGTVYVDWGFADASSLGNGLVALFSGPSGTGKTMAAEVIANAAGLDLYKIDLAAVVSKYVGETESNLGRIFDEAADSDAVLLFDEADALFGERSEVSDAHDRYANVEVDYLLQRVEEHDGAVLLTTNLESNIDDAFLRRVHLGVDFPIPDRAARAEIWRRVFPDDAPVGDLDYDALARLDFTGGNIRNIALSAAFFAADAGATVEMEQVVRAAKRECQKIGRPVQTDQFSEYREDTEST
jgi:SpoVK/Ycf46/Vps4 family AAA+-type ATPase